MRNINNIKDIQSEAGIIATLIYNKDFIFHSEDLSPRYFFDIKNGAIYWAIKEIAEKDMKIDTVNILAVIRSNNMIRQLCNNITEHDIQEIIKYSEGIARSTVDEYLVMVNNVRDKAFSREMLLRLNKCTTYCHDYDGDDIRADISNQIDEVLSEFSSIENLQQFGNKVDDLWEQICEVRQQNNFINFPITKLNDYCQMEVGELIVLAALQKRGKSILLMNFLVTLLNEDKKVLYIDTEIDSKKFMMRLLAHLAQVEYWKIKKQHLTEDEQQRLSQQMGWIKSKAFFHEYMPRVDNTELISVVKKAKAKYDIDAVVFDYLKGNGKHYDDAFKNSAQLGKVTDTLKNTIAGKMKLITICAVQQTGDKYIADSQKIARNASTVCFLKRKDSKQIANDGGLDFGNMLLYVADNRNGAIHSEDEYISVTFEGDLCTFKDCKQPVPQTPY